MKMNALRATRAFFLIIVSVVVLAAQPALADRIGTCTTIDKPGSYVLTRNLASSGDCLVVAADFVTIDLDGWMITGDGSTGGGVTDRGASRQAIAVRNGTITGFEIGVFLGATSGVLVEDVRAIDNEDGGISVGGRSIVSGSTASGRIGITAGFLSNISGNVASGSECGILADQGSTISGNTGSGGSFNGLCAGPESTISGNTFVGAEFGISAGPGSTIISDTVRGINGIVAGLGSSVIGNTARDADGDNGIRVDCPSNVIGNTATGYLNGLVLSGEGCNNIDNLTP